MNTKMLIAGILGGVVYFLLGWLFYGMLLASTFESLAGSATGLMRSENDMLLWSVLLGNISLGMVLAYISSNWAKVGSLQGGLTTGATVGFLLGLGMDLAWYGSTHVYTLPAVFLDAAVFTISSALAGAVIGWWLGRSNA